MDDISELGFDLIENFGEDVSLPESSIVPDQSVVGYYERSRAYWMQVPMPRELAPTGGAPLHDLPDAVLLTMSPTLLVHSQRTAACRGLQVISPRAVPLSCCAARTMEPRRTTDMFIVGCNASRSVEWPVVASPVPADLLPGEPIDAYPYEPSLRPRTHTTGVVAAAARESNPVVRAFIIGRALVDLQRRADVGGSGDALSTHIAAAWGVDRDVYDSMAQASLAPQGPLLRYAVRADMAYPMLNAPVHARKCISVGANTAGRDVFGEDAAIDWRRIRVLAEAVFYMSSRLENHHLTDMALLTPPGDPRADPRRAGVLQFRPLPGSVWCHAPSTFRLDIEDMRPISAATILPDKVRAAVDTFMDSARPVALAAVDVQRLDLVPTARARFKGRDSNEIMTGYHTVLARAATFSSRGKTSVSAVRDYIYNYMKSEETLGGIRALWMVRYLHETARQAGISMLLDDAVVRQLASRFSEAAMDMRVKLAAEAHKRGSDLETWWADVACMLPGSMSGLQEGSASWAIAIAHFLVHPYSHKWAGLPKALAVQSHRSLAAGATRHVRLPARIRSQARVYEAACATARALASSYSAYYGAMYDVGRMLAASMRRMGNTLTAEKLDIAAMTWDLRAKVAATVEITVVTDGTTATLGSHTGPYRMHTSPYAAYSRLRGAVEASRSVPTTIKGMFPHHVDGPISDVFHRIQAPLFHGSAPPAERLFRYVNRPATLASDIEGTLRMMHDDIEATIIAYELEELPMDASPVESRDAQVWHTDFNKMKPPADSYWTVLASMDQEDAIALDDMMQEVDPLVADAIMADSYLTTTVLEERIRTAFEGAKEAREGAADIVT